MKSALSIKHLSFQFPLRKGLILVAMAVLLSPSSVRAATYYWDNNGTTGGFGTAGGTWTAPTLNLWSTDSTGVAAPGTSITTTTADTLNFGTATLGLAAGSIAVTGPVSGNKLVFGSASGEIILGTAGQTITLGGASPTITVNNAADTISSDLAGTAGLLKNGTGTLTLSGTASSLSGSTNINAGTLALTGSLNTSGTVFVGSASGGTLNITGSLTQTAAASPRNFQITNTAGQTGTVNVSGSGSLSVTGLFFGDNGGGNSNLNVSGGTVTNSGQTWFAGSNNSLMVSGGTLTSTGTFEIGAGIASGTSAITVSGTGAINAGTLTIGRATSSTTTIHLGDGTTGGSLSISGISWFGGTNTINFNGGTLTTTANTTISAANAATVVKSGGAFFNPTAGTLTISGNLTDGTGSGGITKSGAGSLTLSGNNTFTGAATLNAGTLTISGNNAYTGATTINAGTFQITSAGQLGSGNYAGNIANAGTFIYNSTSNQTLSGVITGAGPLTKNNTSTLTLSGTGSTVGGTTNVNGGTLTVSGGVTAGGAINVNGTSNPTLNITGALTQTYTGGSVRSLQVAASAGNTGTVNVSGSGSLTLGAGMMLGDNGGGSGTMNVSGGTVTTNGEVWWAGANSILNVSGGTFNATATTRIGGGSGTTTSTLTVSGSGTYNGGGINFGIGGAGASSIINIGNGSAGGNLSVNGMSYNNGTNTINFNGGTLTATNTFSVPTQIATVVQSAGGIIDVAATRTLTISTALTNGGGGGGLTKSGSGTLTLSGTAANTYTGNTTVNGGSLTLAKTAGINAIAGNLTIGDGIGADIVQLTNSNQIADTSVVTFNGTGSNAGILRLNNQSETLAGLSSTGGAGIVENESGSASTGTLTVNIASGSQSFSGILRNGDGTGTDGTLALTKLGNGTQVLTGASTFTGGSAITGGALEVNNTSGSATGSGTVTVNAMLKGEGSITTAANNSVYINGTFQVGQTGSTLGQDFSLTTSGTGGTVLGISSSLELDLWSTTGADQSGTLAAADMLRLFGDVSIAGTSVLKLGNPNALTFQAGDVFRLFDWTGLGTRTGTFTEDFSAISLAPETYIDTTNLYSLGTISIMSIPEPSRALLLASGLAGLLLRRRRR